MGGCGNSKPTFFLWMAIASKSFSKQNHIIEQMLLNFLACSSSFVQTLQSPHFPTYLCFV